MTNEQMIFYYWILSIGLRDRTKTAIR